MHRDAGAGFRYIPGPMPKSIAWLITAITAVFFGCFFVLPISTTVAGAFLDADGKFTFTFVAEVFRNRIYLEGLQKRAAAGGRQHGADDRDRAAAGVDRGSVRLSREEAALRADPRADDPAAVRRRDRRAADPRAVRRAECAADEYRLARAGRDVRLAGRTAASGGSSR